MATISIDVIKVRQTQDKNGHVLMVRLNPADEAGVAAVSLTPCGSQFKMTLSDLDEDGNSPDAGARPDVPAKEAGSNNGDVTGPASRSYSLANRIGMLCKDVVFQRFLLEKHGMKFFNSGKPEERAAEVVRNKCGVSSREHIAGNPEALQKWEAIYSGFRIWRDAPELSDLGQTS